MYPIQEQIFLYSQVSLQNIKENKNPETMNQKNSGMFFSNFMGTYLRLHWIYKSYLGVEISILIGFLSDAHVSLHLLSILSEL
jgi:hypothetical protein